MCNQTQIPLIFVMYFSDIGRCCSPAQKNDLKNQNPATLGTTRIINCAFSKYFRPLPVHNRQTIDDRQQMKDEGQRKKADRRKMTDNRQQTTDNRQNFRFTERQTFLRIV